MTGAAFKRLWPVFRAKHKGIHFVFQTLALDQTAGSHGPVKNSSADFLIAEYSRRRSANPSYSARAFARSLGLSPGFLNLVMQGKKRLSVERAHDVANKLAWTEDRKSSFLRNVARISENANPRLKAKLRLKEDEFFEISDWFHFAILELIKVKRGSVTIQEICKSFGLATTEADFSLKQLTKLGFVAKDTAGYFVVPESYEMPSISSAGIRKFHTQMLQKALASVEGQTIDGRELRALTLSFDKRQMNAAKKEISKFITAFEKKFSGGKKNAVYQMNLAFFQLNKEEK